MDDTRTQTRSGDSNLFGGTEPNPMILVAYAPTSSAKTYISPLAGSFVTGRGDDCDLCIQDDKVSKYHFRITVDHGSCWIEDLNSTNGTSVNGSWIAGKQELPNRAVIRAGRAVLVFNENGRHVTESREDAWHGMAGRFHVDAVVRDLREAAASRRHVLLLGPSGSGKELAARMLANMMGEKGRPLKLLAHNAARFASEEEAAATLFGVAARVFSNVDARPGLIEQSSGGVLFLDEVHNLPERVQRTLLRVIEDSQVARIGEMKSQKVKVRFVFASNAAGPGFGLAHDLLARLRRVTIPSLAKRVADIPVIFDEVLKSALADHNIRPDRVLGLLGGDHYEALCLDGFPKDNARGLVDVADRVATRIATGTEPSAALTSVFNERFGQGEVAKRGASRPPASASPYEAHKNQIIAAYRECGGNVSATVRLLETRGISASRRWLSYYLEQWGVRERI